MFAFLTRSSLALAFGLFLNGVLFWTMWSLTNVSFDIEATEATRIDFTRMRQDTETESRREIKIEREPPPPTPEMPQISISNQAVSNNVISLAPTIEGPGDMNLNLTGGSDRDVMPLVRINPDYPPRALNREQEGWVQVQFTISAQGTVINAVVVESSPPNVFDEAALRAIARWKYNPRVEGGVALERVGMQTVIRFTLEEE